MDKSLNFVHKELPIFEWICDSEEMCICFAAYSSLPMEAVYSCVYLEKHIFRLCFYGVHVQRVLQRMIFHDVKRGLSGNNQNK